MPPKETIEKLKKLRDCGFNDHHFGKIHHFASAEYSSSAPTIDEHIRYCEGISAFRDRKGRNANAETGERIAFILEKCRELNKTPSENDWIAFISEAIKKYPL